MKNGDVFGRLTVIELLPKGRALCRCECGNVKEVWRSNLTRGNTKSCGCLKAKQKHTCQQCGRTFIGGSQAMYCDECSHKRADFRSCKNANKYRFKAGDRLTVTANIDKSKHYRGSMLASNNPLGDNEYRGVVHSPYGYFGRVRIKLETGKTKAFTTGTFDTAKEAYQELLTLKQAVAGNTVAEYLKLCKERDERKKKHDKN